MVNYEIIIPVLFIIAGLGIFLYGFNRMKKYRLIQDTPTSKIRSMAMGLVELHGSVFADKHITSPFSRTKCVYYYYSIKEYRKHTITDSEGKTKTTYKWENVASGDKRIPFFAKDETGSVYVDPDGAEFNVQVKKAFLQRSGIFGAFGSIVNTLKNWDSNNESSMDVDAWGLTPIDPKSHSSVGSNVGDRRYYESYVEPDDDLFVLGTAANSPQAPDNVLIRKGENEPTYIISDKSEKEVIGSLKWTMIGAFVFGGIFSIIGIALLYIFIENI